MSKSTGLRMIDVQVGTHYVLNHTTTPAALVEVGFMTNYSDVDRLQTSTLVNNAARGIMTGIMGYLDK